MGAGDDFIGGARDRLGGRRPAAGRAGDWPAPRIFSAGRRRGSPGGPRRNGRARSGNSRSERCVCAPQSRSSGTSTGPRLSCSRRVLIRLSPPDVAGFARKRRIGPVLSLDQPDTARHSDGTGTRVTVFAGVRFGGRRRLLKAVARTAGSRPPAASCPAGSGRGSLGRRRYRVADPRPGRPRAAHPGRRARSGGARAAAPRPVLGRLPGRGA